MVTDQVDWLLIVVSHPYLSSGHRVGLGPQVDATQRVQHPRQQSVDDKDRFTLDQAKPRALRTKPSCRCFTRRRKPLDVDMVIDSKEAGDVVRHFRPELLKGPH